MGGAYRWDPANSVWIPLLDWVGIDDWNMWGMESIATDPVDTNNLYIAAGMYTNAWTTMNGVILRSTTTEYISADPSAVKFGGNMTGRGMGKRLVVDPNDNNVIYFGARSGNGLWRSVDKGVTWNQVTSFTATGNYFADPTAPTDVIGVVWVAFDPTSSTAGAPCQTIYVGVADTNAAIYQLKDGGNTWTPVPGAADGGLPSAPWRPRVERGSLHHVQRHGGALRWSLGRRMEVRHESFRMDDDRVPHRRRAV